MLQGPFPHMPFLCLAPCIVGSRPFPSVSFPCLLNHGFTGFPSSMTERELWFCLLNDRTRPAPSPTAEVGKGREVLCQVKESHVVKGLPT